MKAKRLSESTQATSMLQVGQDCVQPNWPRAKRRTQEPLISARKLCAKRRSILPRSIVVQHRFRFVSGVNDDSFDVISVSDDASTQKEIVVVDWDFISVIRRYTKSKKINKRKQFPVESGNMIIHKKCMFYDSHVTECFT